MKGLLVKTPTRAEEIIAITKSASSQFKTKNWGNNGAFWEIRKTHK